MFKETKAQGSLEYLIIVAAVLMISAIVVYFVVGSSGKSISSANFAECKKAAGQCKTNLIFSPDDPCIDCESACVVNGKDIMTLAEGCDVNGACGLCKQGEPESIYKIEQKCGDGIVMGDEVCDSDSVDCSVLGDYESGTQAPCLSDCSGYNTLVCTPLGEVNCYDGVDNDGNGVADYADSNCLQIEVVDEPSSSSALVGGLNVLDLKDNKPYIVYRENESTGYRILRYAYKSGDSWVSEVVYDNSSEVVGTFYFAFDKQGFPHVVFYSADLTEDYTGMYYTTSIKAYIRHAWKDASGWNLEIVKDAAGYDPSLVFDSNNNPHFVIGLQDGTYTDPDSGDTINAYHLFHFWKIGSSWYSEKVDDVSYNVGHYIRLAVDKSNNLYASYANLSQPFGPGTYHNHYCSLRYAYKPSGGSWSITTLDGIDSSCGYNSRVQLDSNDQPSIVYSCAGDLKRRVYKGNSWNSPEYLADGAWSVDYVIDKTDNDEPSIAYRGEGDHITYLYKKGTEWLTKTIDPSSRAYGWASLKLGSDGYLYLSYYDDVTHGLKFAKFRPYSPIS